MTKVHGLFNFVKGTYSNDSSCNMQTQRLIYRKYKYQYRYR